MGPQKGLQQVHLSPRPVPAGTYSTLFSALIVRYPSPLNVVKVSKKQKHKDASDQTTYTHLIWLFGIAVAAVGLFTVYTHVASFQRQYTQDDLVIYTPARLSRSRGKPFGRILLGCCGLVVDVSAGRQHYGPNGGYSFFAGRDGSRAFITGKFDSDLHDDVTDFTPEQMAELIRWRDFYRNHKRYRVVGKVIGRFYDSKGNSTEFLHLVEDHAMAHAAEKAQKEESAPTGVPDEGSILCDVSWSGAKGGWVHCPKEVGLYPRRVAVPVGTGSVVQERCMCFNGTEAGEDRRLYDGCEPDSSSCQTSPPTAMTNE